MLDKFWESLGQEMAKRWLDHLFGPAFLFWAGGLGLYIWQHGWDSVRSAWSGLDVYQQAVLLLVALLIVIFSSRAAETFQTPAIRLLEGYWPWPLSLLGARITARNRSCLVEKYTKLRDLKTKEKGNLIAAEEQGELAHLEAWAHHNPAAEKDLLPTRLGNLLRAREQASGRKYGLDACVCWPRLWCLLPECLRDNLTSSRALLNSRAEIWLWGLLFLVWTAIDPIAVLISIAWMLLAYGAAIQTAAVYGDLVETAFDLHRFALYDAMEWPRPSSSAGEVSSGMQLTEFLWRGTMGEEIVYKVSAEGGK